MIKEGLPDLIVQRRAPTSVPGVPYSETGGEHATEVSSVMDEQDSQSLAGTPDCHDDASGCRPDNHDIKDVGWGHGLMVGGRTHG